MCLSSSSIQTLFQVVLESLNDFLLFYHLPKNRLADSPLTNCSNILRMHRPLDPYQLLNLVLGTPLVKSMYQPIF
jgi:hypothetical protein